MKYRRLHRRTGLSRSERRAYLLLTVVLLLVVGWLALPDDDPVEVVAVSRRERDELAAFSRRLRNDSLRRVRRYARNRPAVRRVETFAFDPNTADSTTLLRLGLTSWQAHNALQYGRHGGRWRSAEHFSCLYGLDSATYARLRPYITIPPSDEELQRNARREAYEERRARYIEKYAEGTVIDLNTADTAALKHIPGIGSYYAAAICRYRDRLGGFVSTEQLAELDNLPPDIARWFSVEASPRIRRLNVNTADFKSLARHPYLTYEQVKAIFRYRDRYGKLSGWKSLALDPAFDGADYDRLSLYFEF